MWGFCEHEVPNQPPTGSFPCLEGTSNSSGDGARVTRGPSSPAGCAGVRIDVLGGGCLGEEQFGGHDLCFLNADFSMEVRADLNDVSQAELPASAL